MTMNMEESICSVCKIFGKPQCQVNIIITTGVPYSTLYGRIEYLLRKDSTNSPYLSGSRLEKYSIMKDINNKLFNVSRCSSLTDSSTLVSVKTCCNGVTFWPKDFDDDLDSSEVARIRQELLPLLTSNINQNESNTVCRSPSWVLFNGSIFLDQEFIQMLLSLNNSVSPLNNFSLTALFFLADESQLFGNWLVQNLSIEHYQSKTYPEYNHRIQNLFSLLQSSSYFQENTMLIVESRVATDDKLLILLRSVFTNDSLMYRANDEMRRFRLAKLLSPRKRTVRDVCDYRHHLFNIYNRNFKNHLKPLLDDLQQSATAANAARQIVHLVLNDFERMNQDERRVYNRLMTLGFNGNEVRTSKTIAAHLVKYALELLKSDYDESCVQLIYSIVLVLSFFSSHIYFRHKLFNHTPEIFKLSLLLVNQRHYALALSGLLLCETILDGDLNEHKYAISYLKHDPLSARKIIDTIKWFLSPYEKLKTMLEQNDKAEQDSDHSKSSDEESLLENTETCYFRHTKILTQNEYFSSLTNLFYGSVDHCQHMTVDDVKYFGEIIMNVIHLKMVFRNSKYQFPLYSSILISELCALLTPILQYGSPEVHTALLNESHLISDISISIRTLLRYRSVCKDEINQCLSFFAQFVRMQCERDEINEDIRPNTETELTHSTKPQQSQSSSSTLNLSPDLILSYFNLYNKIKNTTSLDMETSEQEKIKGLLNDEWKKFDIVQLRLDYEQLKQEKMLLDEELVQLRNQLQRTQCERDQFRKDIVRLFREADNSKLIPTAQNIADTRLSSSPESFKSNNQDIFNELGNLAPNEITPTQAEHFIREIYHRRTNFHDTDMRKSICGSLKHLGYDLYSSPVHFLHELIQNAEDNFYDDSVIPRLRIELDHSYILFSNNERGLRAQDVLAICSLAITTKTDQYEHIGEKGVGFKSVFAASNQPMLISRAWRFYFHVPGADAMSFITPLWATDEDIPDYIPKQLSINPQDTHLYLPLKLQPHTSDANEFLNQVISAADPCILLNLNKLKRLEIIDRRYGNETVIDKNVERTTKFGKQSIAEFEDYTFCDLIGSKIRLNTAKGCNTFLVYTCYVNVPNSIRRKRDSNTRVIMAFPYDEYFDLTNTVYAGLPVCDLGINFLFNADFQLVTNRENIREDVPFNAFIRDNLSALFVYLLINDENLRKHMNRYCPSSNIFQRKYSSWWLVMIDKINQLLTKYLSVLLDIEKDKTLRYQNNDFATLVSKEQLYSCANIHVIDTNDSFLTVERLRSFQIESVSIVDVLNCFPSCKETSVNEFRQQFYLWTQKQNQQWWCRFFTYLANLMTKEISQKLLQIPIFLYHDNTIESDHRVRRYLPTSDDHVQLLLFVSNDREFRMWKRQLILLDYCSISEKDVLLRSNHVQLLTHERLIEIIQQDHLQLASSSSQNVHVSKVQLFDEIWKDLFYLRCHLKTVDQNKPFLVPVNGQSDLVPIQNAILPTIFGINIASFIYSQTAPLISLPYGNDQDRSLSTVLRWEHFFLEMKCQRALVRLPPNISVNDLPILPTLTMFTDEEDAQIAEVIFSYQHDNTKNCLRQFPIVDVSKNEQQICPVSCTFDAVIVQDLPTLPSITIPTYCRSLAQELGISTKYDVRTCATVLKLLTYENNTNIDLYVKWLSHLQLHIRQQCSELELDIVRYSCRLYLPDQKSFHSFPDLLIVSLNEEKNKAISIIAKYLKLQLISPLINQIYWQFKDLFNLLNCLSTSTLTISHVCTTIYHATCDKRNFFAMGDCKTILTEDGMETMISLYQYLEDLILKSVKDNAQNTELYNAIIKNKHPTAVCGTREDLEWRFSFTCNSLSQQLRVIAGIQSQRKPIGLVTFNRQMITKRVDTIIYACLETDIIPNLSSKERPRYFVLPLIARTCPLVLATFNIDYIERRGKIQWTHHNHNLEYHLRQLSTIFRNVLHDAKIEVIVSKYASVELLHSDDFVINSTDEDALQESDYNYVYTNYPFWVFSDTVLLCTGDAKSDKSRAITAVLALSTLLHKRKHMPIEEAKLIASQKISTCTAFRSEHLAKVASTSSSFYSYADLVFPTSHHSIESTIISIGSDCVVERDPEKVIRTNVAANRTVEDRIYRNRMQSINHRFQNNNSHDNSMDSYIVDSVEQIRIGQNAEHFFFAYLQHHYGSVDVTPTQNWRSSARLAVYPEHRRNVNDAAGFDFELHDTKELFIEGSGATTKYCYFEVKGTSGPFVKTYTQFHISRHEFEMCESIASSPPRQEGEAYFIIIIEHCLDADKISFGTIINWSKEFNRIRVVPDSYLCTFSSQSSTLSKNVRAERTTDDGNEQVPQPKQLSNQTSDGNLMHGSTPNNLESQRCTTETSQNQFQHFRKRKHKRET